MPNVTLTHTFPKNELNKADIFKKAWEFIRSGMNKKEAFKKAWEVSTMLKVTFWTNAKPEDIQWKIKSSQRDGVVRKDLIRKWDADNIKHPLDWVSYHLRRDGFHIEPDFKNVYSVTYEIPTIAL